MTVRPFSNGTERDMWMSGNCWHACVKAVDAGDPDKPFRCAIQSALSMATMTGEISDKIAERAGFDERTHAGYFPCKEYSDTREVQTRRGPRPTPGQESIL